MKKLLPFVLCVCLLGCGAGTDATEEALAIRGKLLASECRFRCSITVDYEDALETFTLDCESEPEGELEFSVVTPESISGISGKVDGEEGELTFDGQILAFPLLDRNSLSPISAPWILMQTLRKGCITSVARTQQGLLLCIDESFGENSRNLEIQIDGNGIPVAAEISVQGRRVVSMEIEGFTYE